MKAAKKHPKPPYGREGKQRETLLLQDGAAAERLRFPAWPWPSCPPVPQGERSGLPGSPFPLGFRSGHHQLCVSRSQSPGPTSRSHRAAESRHSSSPGPRGLWSRAALHKPALFLRLEGPCRVPPPGEALSRSAGSEMGTAPTTGSSPPAPLCPSLPAGSSPKPRSVAPCLPLSPGCFLLGTQSQQITCKPSSASFGCQSLARELLAAGEGAAVSDGLW